jgi:hypothetical protein
MVRGMERSPRVKSEIRAAAILRRASAAGVAAVVARKGDSDAGTIAIKIYLGRETGARLLMEIRADDGLLWRDAFDTPQPEDIVDARLAKEARFDRDLWIIEIEDRAGRSFAD